MFRPFERRLPRRGVVKPWIERYKRESSKGAKVLRENSATAPSPLDRHLGRRLLAGWIRLVRRSAIAVLALALLLTAGAAQVTITHIGINTNTTDMLSEALPFRRYDRALNKAFPQLWDTLIVVVEAATPDLAEGGARRLAAALAARP